jgi:uncharacterized membrane protein YphA (DoxX/SURF4 family)
MNQVISPMSAALPHARQSSATQTPALTRHLFTAARIVLGLTFFVFGLNGFFNFIPPPPTPVPDGAMALGKAFMDSGYLLQFIKGTEVVAGALLLCNRFVPLALTVLAPVVLNILAFHLFLARDGLVLPLVIVGLQLVLAWSRREAFRPLLAMR